MFKFLRKKRGQSTLEYAVLIIIVIGALLSIQVYIRRGIQGRMKQAADDIGDQYSPGNTNLKRITKVTSNTTQRALKGVTNEKLRHDETTTVISNLEIINVQQEFWGK
jgi:uncharacterized protein (UPF0333 family)